jgi:hypothetical protein
VVEKQQEKDVNVQGLVSSMLELYDFMGATEDLKKIKYFEVHFNNISQTTAACGVFIHWYTQKSFVGLYLFPTLLFSASDKCP